MDLGFKLLKSLIDESVQRVLEKNKLSEKYYKDLNKHTQCSKCYDKKTRDNYKKDRSICRKCYSKFMLEYNSSKRGDYNKLDNSNNFDSSGKQVRSRKEDIPNKEVRKRKQVRIKKRDSIDNQECSNIEDISINNIIDADPNHLCDNLREILSKPEMLELDYTMSKMILDEILRVKCISRKDYNSVCKSIGFI